MFNLIKSVYNNNSLRTQGLPPLILKTKPANSSKPQGYLHKSTSSNRSPIPLHYHRPEEYIHSPCRVHTIPKPLTTQNHNWPDRLPSRLPSQPLAVYPLRIA